MRTYVAPFAPSIPALDGNLTKPIWHLAPWSDDFVDILGERGPVPRHRTRMKLLWGDFGLLIGAEMEEPHLWATLTEHDSVIFRDNDFEVFIDPDNDGELYGELEVNALNTTWDLLLVKRYSAGGPPINSWEIKGLRTAVLLDGTLNDPGDIDRGWSVEILLPWESLKEISKVPVPPEPGDRWKINFSRVQWDLEVVEGRYEKVANRPEHNWVWSPMQVVDMHQPEQWGWLEFGS